MTGTSKFFGWSRAIAGGAFALTALAASTFQANATTRAEVDAAISDLRAIKPGVETLFDSAAGVLIIPEVTKAGLIVGGAYGEGALLVSNAIDSEWTYTAASIGYQIGAPQTRQAMFFMTDEALEKFKNSDGFEIGADAEVTVLDAGAEVSVDTTKTSEPVIVVIYGREGLMGGASVQGGKYTKE
ncbi:MAG: lipid-binding SYLF domain-containing protein [Neomegalonema sp.]|nr:lipid-binding SYLF domain-containing protein [Neomegalonema sp.]